MKKNKNIFYGIAIFLVSAIGTIMQMLKFSRNFSKGNPSNPNFKPITDPLKPWDSEGLFGNAVMWSISMVIFAALIVVGIKIISKQLNKEEKNEEENKLLGPISIISTIIFSSLATGFSGGIGGLVSGSILIVLFVAIAIEKRKLLIEYFNFKKNKSLEKNNLGE